MEYLKANKNDTAELTRMRLEYLRDDLGEISAEDEKIMSENLPEYFEKHLGKDLIAFVAKDGGEVVSAALLLIIEKPSNPNFINGRIGNVLSVYTVPEYRRRGISTKLMEMLLEFAKERGLDFVELLATEDGFPLYKKLGFREHVTEYRAMRFYR